MPTSADDAARLQALEAGIVSLLHELSRDLADVRRTRGGGDSTLRAEWTATELAALALLAVELQAAGCEGR